MNRAWLAATALLLTSEAGAATRQWDFTVFIDKREVGTHRFTVSDAGDGQKVETLAKFVVRILGVRAFHYDHHDMETWTNGCLESIHSTTDSNGKPFKVDGQKKGERLEVQAQGSTRTLQGCVSTFAYWDKKLLERRQLLNSQTGEYVAVSVASAGAAKLRVGGKDVDVERHRITGPQLDITLAYSHEDEWMGLESIVEGGRKLRYQRK